MTKNKKQNREQKKEKKTILEKKMRPCGESESQKLQDSHTNTDKQKNTLTIRTFF
jgi:hypothetical protein